MGYLCQPKRPNGAGRYGDEAPFQDSQRIITTLSTLLRLWGDVAGPPQHALILGLNGVGAGYLRFIAI